MSPEKPMATAVLPGSSRPEICLFCKPGMITFWLFSTSTTVGTSALASLSIERIELASGYAHGSLQAGVTAGAAASSHGQRQKPDTRSETHQNTICPRRVSVSAASVVGDPSEAMPSALRLC